MHSQVFIVGIINRGHALVLYCIALWEKMHTPAFPTHLVPIANRLAVYSEVWHWPFCLSLCVYLCVCVSVCWCNGQMVDKMMADLFRLGSLFIPFVFFLLHLPQLMSLSFYSPSCYSLRNRLLSLRGVRFIDVLGELVLKLE